MPLLPLQIPGGPELLIIFLILFIVFGLIGRWVYRDAKSRGGDWAWQLGVGIPLLFSAGLVPACLEYSFTSRYEGERVEPMS